MRETCENSSVLSKSQLGNLDIVKFVCALLIVTIHAAPLENVSEIANFYLVHVIARVAVPLFFSISGFLFFRKLQWENDKITNCQKNRRNLMHFLKRNATVYVIWSVVYILFLLPKWYRTGWWGMTAVKDAIAAFLLRGTYYHMWYLLASIYAMPILYFLLCYIKKKYMVWIAGFLWICECLTYSYTWVEFHKIEALSVVFEKIPVTGAVFFCAIPLFLIGALCAESKPLKFPQFQKYIAASCFLACALEASALYFLQLNDGKYSYLLTTPFFAYAAVRLMTMGQQCKISSSAQKVFRNMSLTIYCLHPLIIDICTQMGVTNGLLRWVLAIAITVGLAWLWLWFRGTVKFLNFKK